MTGPSHAGSPRRVAQWFLVVGSYKAWDWTFDYALYPFVIYKLGLLRGGILMGTASMLLCLLTLRAYDALGRDWLGIEYVKGLQHYDGPSRFRRALGRLLRRSDWLAFVVLSIRFDPFITTAYLRHGRYDGLRTRDWRNFFGSVLLCNAAWSVACFGGVQALLHLLDR